MTQIDTGKIAMLLLESARSLADWLDVALPELSPTWWNDCVLRTFAWQRAAEMDDNGIDSLRKMDIAALLKVLDKNWMLLSQSRSLKYKDRTNAKDLKLVRNRWAHLGAGGIETIGVEQVFLDLNCIQNFLELLNADKGLIEEVKLLKSGLIKGNAENPSKGSSTLSSINIDDMLDNTELTTDLVDDIGEVLLDTSDQEVDFVDQSFDKFTPGQQVFLKSDPSRIGIIMSSQGSGADEKCQVFIDNKPQSFYLSQLGIYEAEDKRELVSVNELNSMLTAMLILHPSQTTLYSLNAARVDFIPYQFRPALKIIRADQPRLLIADGVGVGKTIEAGLIMRELQARSNIDSILVICPKPLVAERKWEHEMKRFDETFVPIDGKDLDLCLSESDNDGSWPERFKKAIIPYSLFDEVRLAGSDQPRKKIGLRDLDPPPHFDLVIVDEAHHVRNPNTYAYEAVKYFVDNADAVVFLTATPIQLASEELFVLLNLLRPDIIIDKEAFKHMTEPNVKVNEALRYLRTSGEDWQELTIAALNGAAETEWGSQLIKNDPAYKRVVEALSARSIDRDERVLMVKDVEGLHSLSRLINRTRRIDIGEFCVRKINTVEVPFTKQQKKMHDALLEFEEAAFSRIHVDLNVKFFMSMIRRQAASCIFGLRGHIAGFVDRRLDEMELVETADNVIEESKDLGDFRAMCLELLSHWKEPDSEDPKLNELVRIIIQKQELHNNKVMIFSSFRHTLAYLENRLAEKNIRVGLIHGGIKDDVRIDLRKRFESNRSDEKALDVMLFSEVGCEGLDYQFCDTLINYDLPWNPMRIEQRIGRIDRRGQKSEAISIHNFITPGTVDADIYYRCLDRIGIFQQSIGDCEEILGDISREIKNIAENLKLTEEERQLKLEQLADNEVRLIQEQRELEEKEHELFGIKLPSLSADSEVQDAENNWLTQSSIYSFVTEYLTSKLGNGEYFLGDKEPKTLRLSQAARQNLLLDYQKLDGRRSDMWRYWEKWLKGTSQHCSVTFDPSVAADDRDAHFIMPLHPLVRQAASYLDIKAPVFVAIKLQDQNLPAGDHPFIINSWEYCGIQQVLKLSAVCENEDVRLDLFENLQAGVDFSDVTLDDSTDMFEKLDKVHHALWKAELEEHQRRTAEICNYRRQSLHSSNQARVNIVSDLLRRATSPKIQKMKQAELNNLSLNYAEKLLKIDLEEQRADVLYSVVAYGILRIVH